MARLALTWACAIAGAAVVALASVYMFLVFNPDYFREKIWSAWACRTSELPDAPVAKVAFTMPAAETVPKTIYCPSPFPYKPRLNVFNLRSVPPDVQSLDQVDVILFGDSFAWGTGLSEEEAMATRISQFTKTSVLNFSRPGENPAGVLMTLSKLKSENQLPMFKNVKVVVYSFRDNQIARAAGAGRWQFHNSPKYVLTNGAPVFQGYYSEISNLSNYSGIDKLVKFWEFVQGSRSSELSQSRQIELSVALISEIRKIVESDLRAKFYLNIWPEMDDGSIDRRKRLLAKLPIDLKVISLDQAVTSFQHNAHPDSAGAEKMAAFISRVIKP